MNSLLPAAFFLRDDVEEVARDLLGKRLCTAWPGESGTSGIIVETEAYGGYDDKASHAYGGRRTQRTELMFREGGIAYVYLCYGIHSLFNIVTGPEDLACAVLVRAIEPLDGMELMIRRRGSAVSGTRLTAGPGSLAMALGIHHRHTGISLLQPPIWLEEGETVAPRMVKASPRVGVGYAGNHARRPWRFRIRNNRWTSPAL